VLKQYNRNNQSQSQDRGKDKKQDQ